ncbi:MAG: hypothetical protein V2B18_22265 [Pseudomonadota bacterium]
MHPPPENNGLLYAGPTSLVCLVTAVIIVCGTWQINDDLFMALAAGKDALAGGVDLPDRWSFTTAGSAWVNQGWLSGLILYLSYAGLDYLGPLLVKALLLVAGLPFVFLRCRRLGASQGGSLFAMAAAALAVAPLMAVRAENFGVLCFMVLATILTSPESKSPIGQAAALAVLALWSNCHGSFMLGFVLMCLKPVSIIALDMIRARFNPPYSAIRAVSNRRESTCWVVALIAAVPVMAFLNPFGLLNLTMPFQQVASEDWTRNISLWAPLVDFSGKGPVVYAGWNALPFLVALLLPAALLAVVAGLRGLKRTREGMVAGLVASQGDAWVMESFLCAACVAVTARFGRNAVFAAWAFAPITAVLIDSVVAAVKDRFTGRVAVQVVRWSGRLFSVGFPALLIFVLMDNTLLPVLTGNPTLPPSTPAEKIIGPQAVSNAELTEFARNNGIGGRVFANWFLADVLILRVPNVKVFMDLRAQSLYSAGVLKDYESIVDVDPDNVPSVMKALELLDKYGVHAVILDDLSENTRPLVETLRRTDEWRRIFVDPYGYGSVFVRKESREFSEFVAGGTNDRLHYSDKRTKDLSLALMYLDDSRPVPERLTQSLKETVRTQPTEAVYGVIAQAGRNSGCLDDPTRYYLLSELERLSKPMEALLETPYVVLKAGRFIAHTLDSDERRCPRSGPKRDYRKERERLNAQIVRLRREFRPWGKSLWPWQ